jgi:hypothetical protein
VVVRLWQRRRVLYALLGVFVLFTLIYGLCDGVVRIADTPSGPVAAPTRNPVDWVIFSMSAMSPTAKLTHRALPPASGFNCSPVQTFSDRPGRPGPEFSAIRRALEIWRQRRRRRSVRASDSSG